MAQVSYNTYERGSIAELIVEFIRFDQQAPTTVANPIVTIERWDGAASEVHVDEATMTKMSDSETKYVYEWSIPLNAVLDTYLVTYFATVDDMPARHAETIEVIDDS